MIGANPTFQKCDRADRAMSPAARSRLLTLQWRWIATCSLLLPLATVLAQCSRAPSATALAANTQAVSSDTFVDRFPTPSFKERFPTEQESFPKRQAAVP